MSMLAINLAGEAVKRLRIFAKNPSCFFSISMWMRLAETKAISMPEKKAESTRDTKMTAM